MRIALLLAALAAAHPATAQNYLQGNIKTSSYQTVAPPTWPWDYARANGVAVSPGIQGYTPNNGQFIQQYGAYFAYASGNCELADNDAIVTGDPSQDIGQQVGFDFTVNTPTPHAPVHVRYTIQPDDNNTRIAGLIAAAAQNNPDFMALENQACPDGINSGSGYTMVSFPSGMDGVGEFGFDPFWQTDPGAAGNTLVGVSSPHVTVQFAPPVSTSFVPAVVAYSHNLAGYSGKIGDYLPPQWSVLSQNSSGSNAVYATLTGTKQNVIPGHETSSWAFLNGLGGSGITISGSQIGGTQVSTARPGPLTLAGSGGRAIQITGGNVSIESLPVLAPIAGAGQLCVAPSGTLFLAEPGQPCAP